jgi:hypothetical protein
MNCPRDNRKTVVRRIKLTGDAKCCDWSPTLKRFNERERSISYSSEEAEIFGFRKALLQARVNDQLPANLFLARKSVLVGCIGEVYWKLKEENFLSISAKWV